MCSLVMCTHIMVASFIFSPPPLQCKKGCLACETTRDVDTIEALHTLITCDFHTLRAVHKIDTELVTLFNTSTIVL